LAVLFRMIPTNLIYQKSKIKASKGDKMKKFNQDYSIGLDIGVSSVGYAVVADDLTVPTFKFKVMGDSHKKIKKNLIGVTMFESAKTAQETRIFRINGRRIERRNHRISYLRDIFREEIEKFDKNFFRRLDESFRILDDKSDDIRILQPFFGNKELESKYHKKFPTIYHLRKALADAREDAPVADIREVYMALSHILKYRGHFLVNGKIEPNHIDIQKSWKEFLESCQEVFELELPSNYEEIYNEFINKSSRQDKVKTILSHFRAEERLKNNSILKQLLQLLFGLTTKFSECFNLEEEPDLSFSKENYDDNLEVLLGILEDDYAEVFAKLKVLRDTLILSDMLTYKGVTHARFSSTMIERYEEHRKDLQRLKAFFRKKLSEQDYIDMFGQKIDGKFEFDKKIKSYASYISNQMELKTDADKRKSMQQHFYDNLSKKIKGIEGSDYFLDKIKEEKFLRKLRTTDNGAIPNQIHAYEFEKIIERQGKDFPFLLENKNKLMSILTYKIPYFVGPLSKENISRFAWLKRHEKPNLEGVRDEATLSGKIRPWNADKLIDMDETRKAFIDKLIGTDIILLNEKVMPKRSLVYEEVMLHNELTKVKYLDKYGRAHFLDADLRRAIVKNLFKKKSKRVSSKNLLEYLQQTTDLGVVEIIAGIEKNKSFNSTLKTYNDFKAIFSEDLLDEEKYQKELEEIIKIITVFDDKESIKTYLKKNFGHLEFLDDVQIKKLSRLRYTGWGRYSAELLLNIRDEDTGYNLLQFIRTDDKNRNLTQLLTDTELSFDSKIKKLQSNKSEEDDIFEEVKKLAGSPAIKRGILNSIKIVDELVKIMGRPPKNIVIEMARENMTTEEGKNKSKTRQKKLEVALKKTENDLLEKGRLPFTNEQLQSEKLYLYCLQKGKDMYSLDENGNPETLSWNELEQYEVDHIIPYSYLPIDSIDNKVLTRRKNNQNKLDNVPSKQVVHDMKPFWENLYKAKLISQVKFQRLTTSERTPNGVLTEDMKAGFIERQLVETRQITKHVSRILNDRFPDSKVITLKAQLVSNFRNMFHLAKIRELNDYHHAHDAYLSVVVAQTLLKAYPKLAPELVYGNYGKFNRHEENKATLKKLFYSNIMRFFNHPDTDVSKEVWDSNKHLPIIKNVVYNSQINFVKRTMVRKGGFYNQNPVSRNNGKVAAVNRYPLKTKGKVLNPEIYGGYGPINSAISVLVVAEKYNPKKDKVEILKEFHDIDIIDYSKFQENPMKFLNDTSINGFLEKTKLSRVLAFQKIAKYALIQQADGSRVVFESATNLHKSSQFKLTAVQSELFYHMKRLITKSNLMNLKSEAAIKESQQFILSHSDEFDKIVESLKAYADRTLGNLKSLKTLVTGYENRAITEVAVDEETILYLYDNFMKMFSFVKSGPHKDLSDFFSKGFKIDRARPKPNKKLLDATLIHQSITGLYETRIDLSKLGGD
jgi:CRISPR-associated endonuclease Csn1